MRWLPNQLPFSYRLLLAFTVPLLIWVLVSAACIYALDYAQDRYLERAQSRETVTLAHDFQNAIGNIRDEERAWLLTASPAFLESHRNELQRANALYEQLRWRSREQPQQLERLEKAGEILQQWFYDYSRERIEARHDAPTQRVHTLQELIYHLLALKADDNAEPGMPRDDHMAELDAALKVLQEDVRDGGGRETVQRARQELERLQAARASNDTARVNASLQALIDTALPIFRRVRAADDAMHALFEQDHGNELVSDFRETMQSFIDAEEEVRKRQDLLAKRTVMLIHWTIWAGLIIGATLMISVLAWFIRRLGDSVESIDQAAEELARGNLGARIPLGRDSSRLAERFNLMAALLEKRHKQARLLAELGETLHTCKNVNEALAVFGQFASRLFPDENGVLYLIEQNGQDVTAVAHWHGGDNSSHATFTTEDCWGLRLGRLHENDGQGSIICDHVTEKGRYSLCVPLPAFGEIIGMIFLAVDANHQETSEMERNRQFVDSVAEQVALALANVKLREELRNQSIRDSLTRLYNRRHLDDVILRELHRAERHSAPLSILAFDIDHFKKYNDKHGHDGGDAVLRSLGEMLRDFFRPEDGIFRYGGEEFIALLPGTTHDDALARAEELREAVNRMTIIKSNLHLPSITASIGVATWPEHGTDAEVLLKNADMALYAAKHAGRNRVASARNR